MAVLIHTQVVVKFTTIVYSVNIAYNIVAYYFIATQVVVKFTTIVYSVNIAHNIVVYYFIAAL